MDFSTREITSKKVRENDVDFSISQITLKKYMEMTWKFVKIWSWTYRRNIQVESTLIQRGVSVGIFSFMKNLFYMIHFWKKYVERSDFFSIFIVNEIIKITFTKGGLIRYYYFINIYFFG